MTGGLRRCTSRANTTNKDDKTMQYRIDSAAVRQSARGRWLEILPRVDARLIPAINAAGKHVPCPAGTGTTDGFRIPLKANLDGHAFHNKLSTSALSDGFSLLMWLNDWNFYKALKAVHDAIGDNTRYPTAPVSDYKRTALDMSRKRKLFDRWLHESSTEPNTAAIRYYMARGLLSAPDIRSGALRYHESIPFLYDGRAVADKAGKLITTPAILCGMRSAVGVAGFCVIRITQAGIKADSFMVDAILKHHGIGGALVPSKQLFSIVPTMTGSCFRLGEVGSTWGVCEGVETMLALSGALNTESLGAATTASMLEGVHVPDHVKVLNIYSDKDRNGRGQEAASKLMAREYDKREVHIITPETPIPEGKKGVDWLDCINEINKY